MKKIFMYIIIFSICFLLDNTVLPLLPLNGFNPSFLFVFIICVSIVNGKWEGIWLGIAAGILQDLYFYNAFGINCLLNMLICLIAGEIGANIFREKKFIPLVSTFALSFLKSLGIIAILFILGIKTNNIKGAFYISLMDMVICFFIYRFTYKLCQKKWIRRDWKF